MKFLNNPSCQIVDPPLSTIYDFYFGDYNSPGSFIDVGAYDGITYSNTNTLAIAGWSGILIEPVPELVARCKKYLNDMSINMVAIVQCACADEDTVKLNDGYVRLYTVSEDIGTLATINEYVVNTKMFDDGYSHHIKVKCMTLNDILKLFSQDVYGSPNVIQSNRNILFSPGFDVLSIDTEGAELSVLKGFDIEFWQPKLVIVETHENHPSEKRRFYFPDIEQYFNLARYHKIHSDTINSIYISRFLMQTKGTL